MIRLKQIAASFRLLALPCVTRVLATQSLALTRNQVVVAAETGGALGGMVRQFSIDQFENESRRVSYGTPENATAARKLLDRQMSINSVPKKISET